MIYVGQVITDEESKITYLVCHVNLRRKQAAVADMEQALSANNVSKPNIKQFSDIEKMLKKQTANSSHYDMPAEMSYSDETLKRLGRHTWLKKRDRKFSFIEPLTSEKLICQYLYEHGIAAEVEQLLTSNRERLGDEAWQTTSAYYNAFNRFIVFGCTHNALLPVKLKNVGKNYFLPDKIDEPSNIKRGRGKADNSQSRSKSMGITEEHKKRIRQVVAFMKSKEGRKRYPKFTYYKAIEIYQYNFESISLERIIDNVKTETRIPFDECDSLSESQLRYHFKQIVNKTEYLKIRYGYITYEKDYADRQGSAHDGVIGATFRYEVDATVLDLYIRYPFDTSGQFSMGRPVLYLVIDVFSTAIVGFYIGFDGPNWAGASQALVNACSDKVEFAAKFGVIITQDDWPAHHIPVEVTVDNGTEHPDRLITSVLKSEIGIRGYNFTAVFRGDAKGIVERKFKTLNDATVHYIPGALPEAPQRGEQHPSNHAILDYDSLVAEIINVIVLYNNSADRLNRFNINAIREDIDITPNALFKHSLKQEMNGGRVVTSEDTGRIRWAFLPEELASVRSDGVYLDGLVYYSDYAKKAGWFTRAKHSGAFKIPVKRWRQWTSHIWHKTEDNQYIRFDSKDVNNESPFIDQHWEPVLHLLEQFKDKRHKNQLNMKKLRMFKEQCSQQLIRLNEDIIASTPDNTRLGMNPRTKELQRQYAAIHQVKHALEVQEQLSNEKTTIKGPDSLLYDDLDNELFGD